MLARLRFRVYRPTPDLRPAPALRGQGAPWRPSPPIAPRLVAADRARFLNQEHRIDAPSAWNDPVRDKLWLYNLHYFDDLRRADRVAWREAHRALIRRWIAENPPGHGNGWEPYPLSLRIVNWIRWHIETAGLDEAMLHSLAVQARYLTGRLEYHLLANHLLANAKALAFAGMFFEGREAASWLAKGIELLGFQLSEQVLADGAHFELSPMYHAIVLEDGLDLVNAQRVYDGAFDVNQAGVLSRWREILPRMLSWLAAMTHRDGEIAFFNDAAIGIASPLRELEGYARALGLQPGVPPRDGMTPLTASGYVRIANPRSLVIFDAGRVGPEYNPGHAHADTLSFELAWGAERAPPLSGRSGGVRRRRHPLHLRDARRRPRSGEARGRARSAGRTRRADRVDPAV